MREPEQQYEFFVEWKARPILEPSKEPEETYNQRIRGGSARYSARALSWTSFWKRAPRSRPKG